MDKKDRTKLIRGNLDVAERYLQRVLENPSSLSERQVVIPMSLMAGDASLLTQSRWRILLQLRNHGTYDRLQDLADALGRGKHRVSKDVEVLAKLGLLHKEKRGRETAVTPDERPIVVA